MRVLGIEAMEHVVRLAEIQQVLPQIDIVREIEWGFVAFSRGEVVVPPVGELIFRDPPGDAHIKYGVITGDDVFVIKVATGFYQNTNKGLPANSGLVLVFSAHTGLLEAVLLDEGHLTNIRTAAAGAAAAKHLAKRRVTRIGICGSGVQARLQATFLARVTDCRNAAVWARDRAKAQACACDIAAAGFQTITVPEPSELASQCDLIVTATCAEHPYLRAADIRPGTHITAMGSDTPQKCELDPELLALADVVVADSRVQCMERGEIHHALAAGRIDPARIVELGEVIMGRATGRSSNEAITVADLTGVAVQDIVIAKAVLARIKSLSR
jgi:ornithine cyclodeaminase